MSNVNTESINTAQYYTGPKGDNYVLIKTFLNSDKLISDLSLFENSPCPVGSYVMISYKGLYGDQDYETNLEEDKNYGNLNSSIFKKVILTEEEKAAENKLLFSQLDPSTSMYWCYVFETSALGEPGYKLNFIDTFDGSNNATFENKSLESTDDTKISNEDYYKAFYDEWYSSTSQSEAFNNANSIVVGNFNLKKEPNSEEKILLSVFYIRTQNSGTIDPYIKDSNGVATGATNYNFSSLIALSIISGTYNPPKNIESIEGFTYDQKSRNLALGDSSFDLKANNGKEDQIMIGTGLDLSDAPNGAIVLGQNTIVENSTLFAVNAGIDNEVNPAILMEIKKEVNEKQGVDYNIYLKGQKAIGTSQNLNKLQQQIDTIKQIPTIKPYFNSDGKIINYNSEKDARSFISLNGQIQSVVEEHWKEVFTQEIPTRIRVLIPTGPEYPRIRVYQYLENEEFSAASESLLSENEASDYTLIEKITTPQYYKKDNVYIAVGYGKKDNDEEYEWITQKLSIANKNKDGYAFTITEDTTNSEYQHAYNNKNEVLEGKAGEYYFDTEENIWEWKENKFIKVENTKIEYSFINVYGCDNFNEKTAYSIEPIYLTTNIKETLFINKTYTSTVWDLFKFFVSFARKNETFKKYLQTIWSPGQFRKYTESNYGVTGIAIAGLNQDYYYKSNIANENDLNEKGYNKTINDIDDFKEDLELAPFTFIIGYIEDNIFYLSKGASTYDCLFKGIESNGKKTFTSDGQNNRQNSDYYNFPNKRLRTWEQSDGSYISNIEPFPEQIYNLAHLIVKPTISRENSKNYIYSIHKIFIPAGDEITNQGDFNDTWSNIKYPYPFFTLPKQENLKFQNRGYYDTGRSGSVDPSPLPQMICQLRTPTITEIGENKEKTWLFYLPESGIIFNEPTNFDSLIQHPKISIKNGSYSTKEYLLGSKERDYWHFYYYSLRMFCL